MDKEELLKNRYKVIASYPDCHYTIGTVLDRNWCRYENDDEETGKIVWQLSDFPHLFKKLEWYEERKPEDMPEYVKITSIPMLVERFIAVGQIVKVHKHFSTSWGDYSKSGCQVFGDDFMSYSKCQPATREEYEQYINKKQNNDTENNAG